MSDHVGVPYLPLPGDELLEIQVMWIEQRERPPPAKEDTNNKL